MNQQVTEIAVRQVKAGKLDTFKKRRANFIKVLKQQSGIIADREFESFYALPEPDKTEVFIGMTTYETLKAQSAIQRKPGVIFRFIPFFMTMSLKAYVYVQPTEGPTFNLKTLASKSRQVLEVGVRRVDKANLAEFNRTRQAFIEFLSQQEGVLENYEFKVVKGQKTDGLTVGMTVYENQESFMRIAQAIMPSPITQAYFATFTPVALQVTVSTTNL